MKVDMRAVVTYFGILWLGTVVNLAVPSLDAPGSLEATPISSSRIDLSWVDTNNGEEGYFVERSFNSASGFIRVATLGRSAESFSDNGLTSGTVSQTRRMNQPTRLCRTLSKAV